ncbi:cyclase family protein [Pseudokineococcus sp. 1T1Z-3]|uniref:cyclase family protein n=1 Tax=Pseudokineococcus sp. 1T1Z-3 TaxID=3132745 RepID=UPI00309BB0AE
MSADDPEKSPRLAPHQQLQQWLDSTRHTRTPVALADYDALFDELAAAHAGTDDPRGAMARVDDAARLRALAAARTGRSISLAWPVDTHAGPDNARPALHHMTDLGDVEAPEPSCHKDFLGIDYHGKATTHLDAACHIGYRGRLYGGVEARSAMSASGSSWASVDALADGVLLRGVLLDVPAVRGVDWLEPGTALHPGDVAEAAAAHGVQVQPGDAVLVHTGHARRRRRLGAWDSGAASAGLHVDAVRPLLDAGAVLLGSDGDTDVRPSPVAELHSPVHALSLTATGTPLLDNLDLEALADACAEAGRRTFTLLVAPLVVRGGTGSPVNPLAVL